MKSEITVKFKANEHKIKINDCSTIFQLKSTLAEALNHDLNTLHVVSQGKIISKLDDDDIIPSNISVLYVSSTSSPTRIPPPPIDQLSGGAMDNPYLDTLLQNKDFMETIINNNPQIKDMIKQHPEMSHALKDPSFLKDSLSAMKNPNLRKEMQRNQDRQIQQLENIPGGYSLLSSLARPDSIPMKSEKQDLEAQESFAKKFGIKSEKIVGVNANSLPNPWMPVQPKFEYDDLVIEMKDMGFGDKERAKRALVRANGDLSAAIDYYLASL